ncbi:MAG: universal stress protein [Betaproteobacteria bacterium]|nr:universal stress protein [Betaproteobacteria bacterium]
MAGATPYKFLLAVDGSTHANRAVEYLARRAAGLRPCEVHLVYVLTPRIAALLTSPQQDLLLQAGAETAGARRVLDAAGIAYRFHSELGNPAASIVDLIRSLACDEVVVGSRGMSALDSLALGSVASNIVHLSPVPITVVPNPFATSELQLGDGEGIHRVLLPVDGSQPAARAVEYVCALRDARIPVEVRLLNVQIPIASGNVRRFVSQETIDAYCRAEGQDALGAAKKALQAAGLVFNEDIQIGHAGEIIVREALHRGCTRIVMGTRGLGALANVIVGSTALQVMHRSELPVTLVK